MNNTPINYLKRVEISGLWQRYDLVWDLNPDVNVLAGINGSGKTTILNCIWGLLSRGTISNRTVKELKIFFNNGKCVKYKYSLINDNPKNIEKKAKKDAAYEEILSQLHERVGKDYRRLKNVEFGIHNTLFENSVITLNELRKIINNIDVVIISTFDNLLKPSEAVEKLSNNEVKTELDWEIYHLQNKYLDYQLNLGRRKDILLEENHDNIKSEFEKIRFSQTRFLEIIDELFSETGKQINREKNEISFLLDNKEVSPFQLSSGEKQLLIILLTVLIQDNKPSILLMDEPEISLHIEWQRKLIKYIRILNPNVQIIIATHSPDIIVHGWLDNVFNLQDLIVRDNAAS